MIQTRGFLLGKFMPLHEGHLFLCDVASELVDELTVLVCSRDCEPIDGKLRFAWVQDSVARNVRTIHLHRDIPQEPSEHPDFWDIWRDTIQALHPEPIDKVFGSEDYILRLASELNAEPFVLDKARDMVPVSATQVRIDQESNWQYLPPAVKSFYQKRICLLGPESTGKSTLSEKLADHFNTRHVPEYGRTYDEVFKRGENWQASDFVSIAIGHRALQKQIGKRAGPTYFEDTDLLQTIVWAKYLLGKVPEELNRLLDDWDFAQLYLLLKPDVGWINDGTRYSGDTEVRDWFFSELKLLLLELNLAFYVIEGSDWSEREACAKVAVATDGVDSYRENY